MHTRKHAYLIIAYNNWDLLEKLIRLLDDSRNDIYIHINKNIGDFDFDYFKSLPVYSPVYYIPRVETEWGTYGLAEVQLSFYEIASKKCYDYYHNLSGACLPLKSQDDLHQFFQDHAGKEFVHFVMAPPVPQNIYTRYAYYHIWHKYIRSDSLLKRLFLGNGLETISLGLQKIMRVNRQKKSRGSLCYGSNWSSITHQLAEYVLTKKEQIRKKYRFTFAPDETFLQTIVYQSEFKDKLYYGKMDDSYEANMRCIDWKRGNPYTFRSADYTELMNSNYLFARKFDPKVDADVIDHIYKTLGG